MRYLASTIVTVFLTTGTFGFGLAQPAQEAQQLFTQLQDATTSDEAFVRLKAMAEHDKDARRYVAAQLPGLITNTSQGDVWANSVRLAGELKVAETVPVLMKLFDGESQVHFSTPESHVTFLTTMTSRARLDNDPVGKALAKIGEPAISPVRSLLENKDNGQYMRLRAVLVLHNMNLPDADQVLNHQLQSETDPRVRLFIELRLQAHEKTK
jgi:hypothetical protein